MSTINAPQSINSPDCSLELLDGNIYCHTIRTGTHRAADAFISNFEWVYAQAVQTNTPFDSVIDSTNATPPISYLIRGIHGVLHKFPERPRNRTAIVMQKNYLNLSATLIRLLPTNYSIRFFGSKDAALTWLRSLDK
ncbi:MAG: STAS/SEC14 domain-containing protein [Anaerolineae bacterium]|nr:STAS/SEC14 domain-containing protein [Anaerolineae bacterium]